jgi:uncharacterized repeat protein (TIGR03803 family)
MYRLAIIILVLLISRPYEARAAFQNVIVGTFDGTNGSDPQAPAVFDKSGNLFGTSIQGGSTSNQNCYPYGYDECGAVYELSPSGKSWTLTAIASFDGANGSQPYSALALDAHGDLFGTTSGGGSYGDGTVFEVSPPTSGQQDWTLTTLVNFDGSTNGSSPMTGLVFGGGGKLYGTTSSTIFELAPPTSGQHNWTLTTLYDQVYGTMGDLVFDSKGNLYGAGYDAGYPNYGLVYELSPPPKGQQTWTFTELAGFNNRNGSDPAGRLSIDKSDNLYGAAAFGGDLKCNAPYGCGTIFEASPPAQGKHAWTLSAIHIFTATNEQNPMGNLIFDSSGNLYGVASDDDDSNPDQGDVFELSPSRTRLPTWTFQTILNLNNTGAAGPIGGLNQLSASALYVYGTTYTGGDGLGTIFRVRK